MNFKSLLLIITIAVVFIFIGSAAKSQTGSVRGFVYNKETGEPIIFTNVYLAGTTFGATTDVNGYYMISKVPPGNYDLTVTYLGYDTIVEPIKVEKDRIVNQKLYLTESSISLDMVDISAEKQEERTEVKMSMVKITPKEIKKIPTLGGEADIAQYLQVLPGVIFTGDQGGQLYIRGGSPIQNMVLLDGMIIYNPFHSIGLFSVFETDIIRNADIYTGGFNAEYGGRISSVMDITTRDGNKTRLAGKAGISPFGAKALIEGPLKKQKSPGEGSSSFILTGKKSYLEESSKLLYTYMDNSEDTNALFNGWNAPPTGNLPFNFTDIYGKISLNGANGSKFNLFGFSFNDQVNYQAVSDLHWNTFGGGTNFILVPMGSPLLIQGNFAYSAYGISLEEKDQAPRSSGIKGFNAGLDFTYFSGDDEIKYGFALNGYSTEFNFFNALNRKIEQNESSTDAALFFKYKINRGNLVVEPSFRVNYYNAHTTLSPEPRLGAKYNVSDRFRLKIAGGIYSQNLISATSDRDVVNLFYGFLSGPSNLQDEFMLPDGTERELKHNLQKATHAILGAEVDITRHINLNVEGYYKKFNQLTNINRNKIHDDTPDNFMIPDRQKKDFIVETGDAYGVDFVMKYDRKKTYLWAVYSLGYVTRWDGDLQYYPVFDRRHNVNLVGSYTFGKGLLWEATARWNFGSGFPFTKTQGYYEKLVFDDINADVQTANGDLGIQYADLNSGRLPTYHRFDVNLKREFIVSEYSTLETNFGITNIYNRENIFYFDRIQHERVNQLPVMPSIGLTLTF